MHQAYYRKWRPSVFAEVYGQDHITSVLRREVSTGKISHAYLFCGSRGTGKTSCAKILAGAVNCETPRGGEPCGVCSSCRLIKDGAATDILELDAASNNGVENVRDIRDEVIYTPAMLKRRVYIIDEVHMLSAAAFNALLKTLEEPPAHVVFILATTEPQKLPATIISRCQRFDFKRIDIGSIVKMIGEIAAGEGIKLDGGAASLIARLARGGMRDAISMLELCAGEGGHITEAVVREVAGVADRAMLYKTALAVSNRNTEALFDAVEKVYSSSIDMTVFWADLLGLYRDMLVIKSTKNPRAYLDLTESELSETKELARGFTDEALAAQSELADEALVRMSRTGSQKRLIAELTLVRMSDPRMGGDFAALAERIAALEMALTHLDAGGNLHKTHTDAKRHKNEKDEIEAVQFSHGKKNPERQIIVNDGQNECPESTGSAVSKRQEASAKSGSPANAGRGKNDAPADDLNRKRQAEILQSKPYMRWADAVARYAAVKGCEAEAGFLELARAFVSRAGFNIVFENRPALGFVENDGVLLRLSEILSELEGRAVAPSMISFSASAQESAGSDSLDDFNM